MAYAMDYRGTEGAAVLEEIKQSTEPERAEEATEPQRREAATGRDLPIDESRVKEGVANGLDALMQIAGGAMGKDMSLTAQEKGEAKQYVGPVAIKRAPNLSKYSPEAAATLWFCDLVARKVSD